MMTVSRFLFGSMGVLLVASLAAGVLSFAHGAGPQKIRVLTLLGRPLQFVVADQQGFFAKHGLDVENLNQKNSDEVRGGLAAGQGDLAYLALDNAVAMIELAHADAVIVMGGEGSQNELIAQPQIKSIKDLRGKTLIVDATYTAYALQMKKILLMHGMEPGRDYEMKAYGATPARLIAMRQNKDFAGSMLGPPASIEAKREGFTSLGSVQDLIGPYQAAGFFTMRPWAKDHRDTLVSFLAACIESQRWILAPANKQQVIELLSAHDKLSPEVAAETYESLVTLPGGYEKDAQLDLSGFKNVLKLRAEMENQWGGHPPSPEKFYDSSYYDAALSLLRGSR
jgi:ABC-type nitrate/sulfonate/bicarbonate transport system substrate-binding protein